MNYSNNLLVKASNKNLKVRMKAKMRAQERAQDFIRVKMPLPKCFILLLPEKR